MGLVAAQLLARILFSEAEDPKEFLKRQSAKLQAQGKKPRVILPSYTPAQDWPDWEDLEEWQQVAAHELEAEEDMTFSLSNHDNDQFTVRCGDLGYTVYKDEDTARQVALNQVHADLGDEPENFNQDWLRGFIDMDHLRHLLHNDARDDDYWNESHPDYEDKLKELMERDVISDDPRDDTFEITPEIEELIDEKWEEMIEAFAKERMEDPIAYLADIQGEEEAIKWAFENGRIDIDAAAESAINTDGWQHFLSRYDGHSHDLPSGAVYVRE